MDFKNTSGLNSLSSASSLSPLQSGLTGQPPSLINPPKSRELIRLQLQPGKPVAICGKLGTGKTTLVKNLIQSFPGKVFTLDYIWEYGGVELNRPADFFNNQSQKVFSYHGEDYYFFCDLVYRVGRAGVPVLVVFEEVDSYGNDEDIKRLYRVSRHAGICLVSVLHKFTDVPPIIRAVTVYWIFFQITERNDLDYLDSIDPDLAAQVYNLPNFSYITEKI